MDRSYEVLKEFVSNRMREYIERGYSEKRALRRAIYDYIWAKHKYLMKEGRPEGQAFAIAYSMIRKVYGDVI